MSETDMTGDLGIKVKLTETGSGYRRPCLVCDGCSEKWQMLAKVYDNGEWTGLVVCKSCLRLSDGEKAASLRGKAAGHREQAAYLEALAANLPAMPSHADWERAMDDENASWVAGAK